MGIEITNQINEQECGVCVLTSLHNHFYSNDKLEKQSLLDLSKISRDGLSIFDFESLAKQVKLSTETYQLTWDEFVQLKVTKYFVLLLSTNNGGNHYVIAKKKRNNMVEIYDSANSTVKQYKYEQLKPLFLEIIILINKAKDSKYSSDLKNYKSLLMINIKQILLSIVLYSIVFLLAVVMASFLNWVIDLAITKKSISNLITICFTFALVYILNDLMTYIVTLYSSNYLKDNLILLTSKALMSLSNKNPSFLNKVDKTWIYKIDECVYNIANYCVVEINKFITNIIFIIVCICIVGAISPWLLIFCGVYLLIELSFFFLNYSKKKDLFTRLLKHENKNTLNYKELISNLENEYWYSKRINHIHKIKTNYGNLYKNFHDVNLYKANTSLCKSLLKSLFEILLFGTIAYLAIKNESLTIGRITFVISSINLMKSASEEMFNFFLYRIEFLTYWQIYSDLIFVDNNDKQPKQILLQDSNVLSFNYQSKQYVIKSNVKENIIPNNVVEIFKDIDQIKINDKPIGLNTLSLSETLIVIDEYTQADKQLLISLFQANPTLYGKYIRLFNLDLNDKKVGSYQNLLINLMNLLDEKNKIIILDSIDDLFKEKDVFVIKEIINKLNKDNYVFITRKE